MRKANRGCLHVRRRLRLIMNKSAFFSPCRTYRFMLKREWWSDKGTAVFIGLNPSIADEHVDDMTIKKCIGFSQQWNCGALIMVNLYALVSTQPAGLLYHPDPVGNPMNDDWIEAAVAQAFVVVAAWGCVPEHQGRAGFVRRLVLNNREVHCLGLTKGGFPRHPSRIAYSTKRELFKA
jgi:hypothetical protein